MAKKKRKKTGGFSLSRFVAGLRKETLRAVSAILLFIASVLLLLAAFEQAGVVGNSIHNGLTFLLGVGYFLVPLLFLSTAAILIRPSDEDDEGDASLFGAPRIIASIFIFVSGLGLLSLIFDEAGGVLGKAIANPLVSLFDFYSTILILGGVLAVSIVVLFDLHLQFSLAGIKAMFSRKEEELDDEDYDEEYYDEGDEEEESEEDSGEEEDAEAPDDEEEEDEPAGKGLFGLGRKKEEAAPVISSYGGVYTPPPLSLFTKDRGKPGVGDIKANANLIKRTLQNFGIQVEVDEISVGPTVTRFAIKPAEGVRISKIVSLQNNLELALAAHPVRIEAPIPGRSLVGIEVPNTSKAMVSLGTLLGTSEYQDNDKPLLVVLGRDITGTPHFANLGKMPHVLIAGATGSGKSVAIHSIISSLLFRNSPDSLRFIMVDPKRVELTLYNSIPHLLTPVVTEAKKAILALKWAAKEMERRYDVLEAEQVRDIDSYHKNVVAPALEKHAKGKIDEEDVPERMPYIVVVIDELADIMQAYPRELESAIVRLAQMSRAVGIHLILSTQRPSVNVITGLIKANVPARVALQVSSQIDSRTILDTGGAEKLLGAGDMLYLSGEMSKPVRIQTALISEQEVKKVVKFLKDNHEGAPEADLALSQEGTEQDNPIFAGDVSDDDGEEDELYDEARRIVIEAGKASTSYLQRRLRLGYSRAARLIDLLEERGVIGPADGSRPREILETDNADDDGYEEEYDEDESDDEEER